MPKVVANSKSIYRQELIDATGFYKRKKWTETTFRKKLLLEVHNLPDNKWSSLSAESQKWVNDATNSVNNEEKYLPPFPDEEEVLESRTKRSGNSASNRERNKKKNSKGAGYRAKELLLEKGLDTYPSEIYEELQKEGYDYSIHTLKVIVSEFRRGCRILKDKGYLLHDPKGLELED